MPTTKDRIERWRRENSLQLFEVLLAACKVPLVGLQVFRRNQTEICAETNFVRFVNGRPVDQLPGKNGRFTRQHDERTMRRRIDATDDPLRRVQQADSMGGGAALYGRTFFVFGYDRLIRNQVAARHV